MQKLHSGQTPRFAVPVLDCEAERRESLSSGRSSLNGRIDKRLLVVQTVLPTLSAVHPGQEGPQHFVGHSDPRACEAHACFLRLSSARDDE